MRTLYFWSRTIFEPNRFQEASDKIESLFICLFRKHLSRKSKHQTDFEFPLFATRTDVSHVNPPKHYMHKPSLKLHSIFFPTNPFMVPVGTLVGFTYLHTSFPGGEKAESVSRAWSCDCIRKSTFLLFIYCHMHVIMKLKHCNGLVMAYLNNSRSESYLESTLKSVNGDRTIARYCNASILNTASRLTPNSNKWFTAPPQTLRNAGTLPSTRCSPVPMQSLTRSFFQIWPIRNIHLLGWNAEFNLRVILEHPLWTKQTACASSLTAHDGSAVLGCFHWLARWPRTCFVFVHGQANIMFHSRFFGARCVWRIDLFVEMGESFRQSGPPKRRKCAADRSRRHVGGESECEIPPR